MKTLHFLTEPTQRMVEFTESAPAAVRGKRISMRVGFVTEDTYRYDEVVDLESGVLLEEGDEEYNLYGTIYDYIQQGLAKEIIPYKKIELDDVVKNYPQLCRGSKKNIPDPVAINNYLKEHGMETNVVALEQSYKMWKAGFKCGIRDEKTNTFIFNPTGAKDKSGRHVNPYSVSVSELNPLCEEWQQTYYS